MSTEGISILEIARRKNVTAKLHTMRKAQEFSVYPRKDGDNRVIVQSDKAIGVFDAETGAGLLNMKGHYFPHLNLAMGAVHYQFPVEFVKECLQVWSK